MTRKLSTFVCGALLGAALFIPLSISAQDPKAKQAEGGCGGCCEGEAAPAGAPIKGDDGCCPTTPVHGDGGMSAPDSQKQMQEAFEAAAKPGDNHRKLDAIVGTFDVKATWFCDPSGKPQETTGVSVNAWTLGGRFVEQRFFGQMPGTNAPFEGIGFTGFDNLGGKFVGSWMDNQMTGLMMLTGKADAAGKAITFTSEHAMPGGGTMQYRMVLELASRDRHVFTMYMTMAGQPEMKGAEMVYTRK